MKDLFKEFVSILKAGFDELAEIFPLVVLSFAEAILMVIGLFALLEVCL